MADLATLNVTGAHSSIPGIVVAGDHFGGCDGWGDYIAEPADMFGITHFNPIGIHDLFPRSVGSGCLPSIG
jgi:hypothetical protein